jgi:hypothetical protein
MAVRIKFLSVIVPIEKIDASPLKGGLRGILQTQPSLVGKAFWHDDNLFVEYAMNPIDVQSLVQRWESLGLVGRAESNGVRCWKDVCVVDYYNGPTLPCAWLEFDPRTKTAWKKGSAAGEVVGPVTEDQPLLVSEKQMQELRKHAVPQKPNEQSKPWWKLW